MLASYGKGPGQREGPGLPVESIGCDPILQILHGEKSKGGSRSDAEGKPRD